MPTILASFIVLNASLLVHGQSYARLSPFTDVDFNWDRVEVQYEGHSYDLISVNGVPVATRGLIIDVRGNTGGGPEVLHALIPYLMGPDEEPFVVTAAKFRTGADYDPDFAGSRLLRADSPDWSPHQRQAIQQFQRTFQPKWNPPSDEFSPWYYEVVDRADNPRRFHYDRPIVVLQDDHCFSATDVLLSALKGRPNVTLVGVPSAGGSGGPREYYLLGDEVTCVLSTYAGFQPNGELYDGNGIEPDIVVHPCADYFIGKRDNVLEKAITLIKH